MSDYLLATVISFAIIAAMFAWVPLLKLVCPPCSRFFKSRRRTLPTAGRTSLGAARKPPSNPSVSLGRSR